jgi:predicted ATPase/transcriptional regulator with XRE-family HTH domain
MGGAMTANRSAAFGKMLRESRLAASLTQEALAEAAGVSARAVADLERGVIRAPQRDTLNMLANALNLTDTEREDWHRLRQKLSARSSARTSGRSIPLPANQLLGRDREVHALVNLMTRSDTRLITVVGQGGVGKTRIALAVGHALEYHFEDGIHFIELASVRDPRLLLLTVAHHLGIRDGSPDTLRETVVQFMTNRHLLLILDNAEHLQPAANDLSFVLANTSAPQILVTSRAGLRLEAEHEFPVHPLKLPQWNNTRLTADLQEYPAIQLFVQRAQQVRPDFYLTDENSAAVTTICSYLDGLPLAIELAATRIKVLSPEQMVPRLVDRLGFLTGGRQDAPDRHRTMRAAIAWSYDLLDEAEQQFFRRFSTFVGGWTLEAADAFAPETADVLDRLAKLANDNLIIQHSPKHGQPRFSMLETVREFGIEQLRALGEYDQAQQDHAEYFLGLAQLAGMELRGPHQAEWLDRLSAEIANLRSAFEWMQRPDVSPELALRMAASLTWFWETRGQVTEGRAWLIRSLQRDSGVPSVQMKALAGAGWFSHIQQDADGASRYLNDALHLAREIGDQWWEAWVLHLLGRVAYFEGDADSANRYGEASLAIAEELDDPWLIAWDEHLFGLADYINDDLPAAHKHYARSLEIRETLGYPEGIGLINGLLGMLAVREGDYPGAFRLLRKGLEIGQQISARWLVINWLANIVLIAADTGSPDRAARLAGFVQTMSGITGAFPIPITNAVLQQGIHTARERLGDDVFQHHYAAGQALSMDDAIIDAMAIEFG